MLVSALSVLAISATAAAQPAVETRARVALQDEPAGAALRLLDDARLTTFPVAIRVELDRSWSAAALDARIGPIERRALPVWLAIPAPMSEREVEPWRTRLRAIFARDKTTLAILEVVVDGEPSAVAAFAMQVAATEARVRQSGVQLALGGAAMADPVRRNEIYSAELAPYVDLLVIGEGSDEGVATWLRGIDPGTRIALRSSVDASAGVELSRHIVDCVIEDFDTAIAVRVWNAVDVTATALTALVPMSALLTHSVSALDPAGVEFAADDRAGRRHCHSTSPASLRQPHVLHLPCVLG